jgi:hypothetical protein
MSFMKNLKNARVVASMGLGILAACSDSNGPQVGEFNTARVEAGISTVQRVAAAPVLGSLTVTGRVAGGFASTSLVGDASDWTGLETAVQRVASATAGAGAALIPVMQSSVLGKTFVYDASTRKYVPDASRTGAPTNGVRFVLYETGGTGEPVSGREIGYAELTDERRTSPTTAGVRLVVVSGGITHLDYAFDLTGSLDAASFVVQGFLSDGTDRVNFSIRTSSQMFGRGGDASVDATLTVPRHDFTVTAKARGLAGESNGDGTIDLTVRSGGDEIVVEAQTIEGQIDATFTVNGEIFATATGDATSPTIRGQGGRELTADELHALGSIVKVAEGLFELVGGLLAPAGALLLIALGVR